MNNALPNPRKGSHPKANKPTFPLPSFFLSGNSSVKNFNPADPSKVRTPNSNPPAGREGVMTKVFLAWRLFRLRREMYATLVGCEIALVRDDDECSAIRLIRDMRDKIERWPRPTTPEPNQEGKA